MNKKLTRWLAALLALSLVAAACGGAEDAVDDAVDAAGDAADEAEEAAEDAVDEAEEATEDDEEAMEDDEEDAEGEEDEAAGGETDGVLTIGTIFPVTGDLAFLGPAEIQGAELAVADLNEAGGVLGGDVVLEQGDSGDTTTDTANTEVDRLLSLGSDAIIGAASSAVSLTVIDKITGAGVIQFSPANTSPEFTTYDDNGLYFRTAPSDVLQGRVLANQLIDQGNENIGILFRQESYGQGLADAIQENFESSGGAVAAFIPYAVDTESFDAEVDQLVEVAPDAIVVVGFAESANIVTTMNERGIGPTSDTNVWGVDGNVNLDQELDDPTILSGMMQTVPSVDLGTIGEFVTRLEEAMGPDNSTAFGAETYDSVVITALAAAIAGSDDGKAIAAEINGVTRDGEICTTPADCLALIEAGTDIDYDGLGGPYEFEEAGEPAAASFRIDTYGDAGADEASATYIFAS